MDARGGTDDQCVLSTLNNGGYVLVEADDPSVVYSFVSKFTAWNESRSSR